MTHQAPGSTVYRTSNFSCVQLNNVRTTASKLNVTPKVLLPISKLHSILAVANLLAHNNLWLCYHVQVNSKISNRRIIFLKRSLIIKKK